MFKNQKSNGFYLESTVNCSLKYFTSLYSLVCFATLFLTIFGADYTKNTLIPINAVQVGYAIGAIGLNINEFIEKYYKKSKRGE